MLVFSWCNDYRKKRFNPLAKPDTLDEFYCYYSTFRFFEMNAYLFVIPFWGYLCAAIYWWSSMIWICYYNWFSTYIKFDFLRVNRCAIPELLSLFFEGDCPPFAAPSVAFLRWNLLRCLGAPLWKPLAWVIYFRFGEKFECALGDEICGRFVFCC